MRRSLGFLIGLAVFGPAAAAPPPAEDVPALLQRQAQEIADAVAPGRVDVFARLLDDAAIIVDEGGGVSSKKELIGGLRPLPEGVSGSIRVTDFRAAVHGD